MQSFTLTMKEKPNRCNHDKFILTMFDVGLQSTEMFVL
jgi:hypothetical protein